MTNSSPDEVLPGLAGRQEGNPWRQRLRLGPDLSVPYLTLPSERAAAARWASPSAILRAAALDVCSFFLESWWWGWRGARS